MSPAAKLVGFLLLLGAMFIGAHAAGARLGPVTAGYSQPANGRPMNMNMGATAPAGTRR